MKNMNEEKHKRLEIQKLDDEQFQEEITDMVNNAEKITREYEISFKKALKESNFIEENPYLEIINIYEEIKRALIKRGWNDQISIYNRQIKLYNEKLKKHKKIKEIEEKKAQGRKEIREIHKISVKKNDNNIGFENRGKKSKQDLENKKFEEYIDRQVDKAEKIARDYETQLKKGNFNIKCPYSEIINIYRNIRDELHEYGWNEESLIYANQIKLYKNKLEKDFKLREIEAKKTKQNEESEKTHKFTDNLIQEVQPKGVTNIKQKELDEKFQEEITRMVNQAERLAREYENKLKRGELDAETTYPEVIKIYRKIRKSLLDKGWQETAVIYLNQINIYKEKIDRVQKLREIEAKKLKHQEEIEKMHRTRIVKKKPIIDKSLESLKLIEEKKEENLNKAMSIINEAEKQGKSYELKLKSRLSDFESPYNKVIELYKEAKKILIETGWKIEANHIDNTIEFYENKKKKDDKIRELEKTKQKEKPAIEVFSIRKSYEKREEEKDHLFTEIENKKKKEQKIFEEVFEILNKAEELSEKYNENIMKEGILSLECPYGEIINIYRRAKEKFEDIGWKREVSKLNDSIDYFRNILEEDNKLREEEQERIRKKKKALSDEQMLIEQLKKEKEDLTIRKEEILRKEEEEKEQFEIQKKRAFKLMDEAKKELEQNNFNKALDLYKNSKNIFEKINWNAGLTLINDSIELINNRKNEYEKAQKDRESLRSEQLKLEKDLEDEIKKIGESKKIDKMQKQKERTTIQEQKKLEEEISKKAYNLLEKGTKFKELKQFDKAYEKYMKAKKLFSEINWYREVSHINQELLDDLNKKKEQALRLEKYQKKKEKEEQELEQLLNIAEEQKKELKRIKVDERRKKLAKDYEEKVDELELANILIKNFRYNEAALKLIEKVEILKKRNKPNRIDKINNIIKNLKEQTQVPLIVLDNLDLIKNKEFITSYEALDKAQKSITKGKFMKAVSELNEAKYHLEKIEINQNILDIIENRINNCRKQIGIEKIDPTKEKNELEDLKLKIAQSRALRRKKIENLKKGK